MEDVIPLVNPVELSLNERKFWGLRIKNIGISTINRMVVVESVADVFIPKDTKGSVLTMTIKPEKSGVYYVTTVTVR